MSRCGNVDRSFDLSYLISTEKKTHITRFAGDMRFLFFNKISALFRLPFAIRFFAAYLAVRL